MKIDDGESILVEVDFLAGEYGGTESKHRHQDIQDDLKARKARGCELALRHHTTIVVEGTMPGGARNSVQVNLSEVVPFIVMKGMALDGRKKEKDAWDIYFCIQQFEGGPAALAKTFEPILDHGLVHEGLAKIRSKFTTVEDYGPTSVADFEEVTDREDRERIKRDAFEKVTELIGLLGFPVSRE